MNCREKYDVIFIDAYNDLSIPYHLTTREFAGQLKNILNAREDLTDQYYTDNFQKGSFLPSYIRDLREVFGEKNVHLISISPNFEKTGPTTFIVLTGKDDLNIKDFEAYIRSKPESEKTSAVVPEDMINKFIAKTYSVVLRDDYAPVDNLIAPVFEERFGYNRRLR